MVKVAPFVDLVLTWNTGISYGWFQQEGPFGQWALLALKVVAVALLWIWLARADIAADGAGARPDHRRGVGNAIDRLAYGAVADFVLLHVETATWRFNWYVFNLADVAIVAGVVGLLYESLLGGPRRKSALIPGIMWLRKPQTAVSSRGSRVGMHDELQVQAQIQPRFAARRHDRHGGA